MTVNVTRLSPGTRNLLRVVSVVILLTGLAFTVTAFASFLNYDPGPPTPGGGLPDGPDHFWMGFVGLPLLAIGVGLARLAFLKPMSEIVATETAGAVEVAAGAAGRGLVGAGAWVGHARPVVKVRCRHCSYLDSDDAKFCSNCGKAL